ncbi:MAG: hypothetical protein Q8Q73_10885 [Stagnimonas sp.]|nr:hypothetical protein [Stagnimonas sp.]
MSNEHKSSTLGRRTAVSEGVPFPGGYADYADAFEIGRNRSDHRHAESWVRDAFGHLPLTSRRFGMLAHRHLLGFRLGPWSSPDHIFGWHIAESRPDVLHLEASGNIMDGRMIWRLKDDRLVMTTFVKYNRPRLAAGIWALAGRIHRDAVPGLLANATNKAKLVR